MSLYEQAAAIERSKPSTGASPLIQKTLVVPTEAGFKALAAKIEAAYPKMTLNAAAMAKSGMAPDGVLPRVPFAVKQGKPKAASITVYYNGTVVWTGCTPV